MAGIALGREGTGVGRLCGLMCHCGCYLSAPLFFLLVHPVQLGVFLLHSYSAKQVRRSFGHQCDSSYPEWTVMHHVELFLLGGQRLRIGGSKL